MQLLNFNWPANILAGLNFRAQENGLMSPDGVCAISAGPAGHETRTVLVFYLNVHKLAILVFLIFFFFLLKR